MFIYIYAFIFKIRCNNDLNEIIYGKSFTNIVKMVLFFNCSTSFCFNRQVV